MLPRDITRCEGRPWPDFGVQEECRDCLRRQIPQDPEWLSFMQAPPGDPCPMRIVREGRDGQV